MNSPFKFLDAYTPADRDYFFGRDAEIEALYNQIHKSRMLLVYGQSGTGKTSLVQCGLGGRFDATDWYPFNIRRNNDINRSLTEALSAPLEGQLYHDSITESIAQIYKTYLRPLYLIFDQMEELFILGSEAEQKTFIQTIKAILAAELPCKIILIMREEYIAHLYYFEQEVPTLFDRRVRVEPMNYANVSRVITGSCEKFNIALESSTNTVNHIIDQISSGKSGVPLPYLQVYLDRLWQADYERTYPGGAPPDAGKYPALQFTTADIDALGNIEDVLEKFLRFQAQQIQTNLAAATPGIPDDAVRQVLDLFVTEDGTKRPVPYERKNGQVVLEEKMAAKLAQLPPAAVQEILARLEQVRILRFTENLIELAHDSLADRIDRDRSSEQRQLNLVKQRLNAAYVEYRETGAFLTGRQLDSIEPFLPKLALEPQMKAFIQSCYAEAERLKQAEEERHRNELRLVQEKLDARRRAAMRQRIILAITLAVGLWGWYQNIKAKETLAALQKEKLNGVMEEVEGIELRANLLRSKYKPISDSLIGDASSLLFAFPEKEKLVDSLKKQLESKQRTIDSLSRAPE